MGFSVRCVEADTYFVVVIGPQQLVQLRAKTQIDLSVGTPWTPQHPSGLWGAERVIAASEPGEHADNCS